MTTPQSENLLCGDPGMTTPRIHLHIDRLVLRGVPPTQRDALVAALRAQLQSQLASPGMASDLGAARHVARVHAQSAVQAAGTDAAAMGRAFADGMLAGLKP